MGCILSALLSLGSKQIAATLPMIIFLYEWYFFQDLSTAWLKKHLVLLIAVLILFLLTALLYLGLHPVEEIVPLYDIKRDFGMAQRVLTQFRVIIFYLSLLIFPHPSRLNLEHDFSLSQSLFDPLTTIFSMGIVMGLFGLSLFIAKKHRILSFLIHRFFTLNLFFNRLLFENKEAEWRYQLFSQSVTKGLSETREDKIEPVKLIQWDALSFHGR